MNTLKKFDNKFLIRKTGLIAGCDEAGRGPLAGPVVAAAVIFDKETFHKDINDSKQISEKKREELYKWILDNCLSHGIGIISHGEIDEINILQASLKAMKFAVEQLEPAPNLVLIDGNKSFISDIKTMTVIKGDSKSFSIASASIIAKVTRDRIMTEAHEKFPQYLWEQNKGYPTLAHRNAVKIFGASSFHRKTFLKNIFDEKK
ncbi:MAG: ribonuclease HII [Ignavibacteriae bacterium HGW-Ignavibacteriae-3]|nr:MAG: ribonuclease HII [Ignavibacteriae bacterium HGW-Ignavibacteriae-3]